MGSRYKASTTIELSMMMPVILLVITAVIYAGFYYHDKNIIYSKVYELGAIGKQESRLNPALDCKMLEEYLEKAIENKVLLITEISCSIEENNDQLCVTVEAYKRSMSIKVEKEFAIYYVEQNIRQ